METRYPEISSRVQARANCEKHGNAEWLARHREIADKLVRDHFPSGSGFDAGTRLDWDRSTGEKLVFQTSFHHMDESGGYDGWTEHTVTVRPTFSGVSVSVSGRNRNDIKTYICEVFAGL